MDQSSIGASLVSVTIHTANFTVTHFHSHGSIDKKQSSGSDSRILKFEVIRDIIVSLS
jgi:hypothetical protein